MDGRKALEVQVDPRTAPVVPPASTRRWPAASETEGLPIWLAATAALLGPVLDQVLRALEPAPAHPDAAEPLLAVVVAYVLLGTWLGAAVAGLARRPAALAWAAGTAALYVAMVVACPTSGHHASVGAWWYGEMAISVGALAGTLAGLRWAAGRRAAPA